MEKQVLSRLVDSDMLSASSDLDITVSGICYRSDRVCPGDVFFCIPGHYHDGHDFAEDAVARGAAAIVCARPIGTSVPEVLVPDVRIALARAAARFWGEPSKAVDVAGITGTNGKTTTTHLLDSIMRADGRITGLIGTVETRFAGGRAPSTRTTPESADLQLLLAEMRDAGVQNVSMEVSSHAIDLHRIESVHFAVAAFTNLTQDHLDYHRTLDNYWQAKRRLFTEFDVEQCVVNIDDARGRSLAVECGTEWTVGRAVDAAVRASDERAGLRSTVFTLTTPFGATCVDLPLAGAYNVSNALVAAGCALVLGAGLDSIIEGLKLAPQVPGRLERVEAGQPFAVFVDYAHTPDSIEKAIAAVRAVTPGHVITVFGCGGDRDPLKRPLMGAAAGSGSDIVIVTSDNPRSESPEAIIESILTGLDSTGVSYEIEADRRRAIGHAFDIAGPSDAVLIAGKGHEDYQVFADRTIHFDDREIAREELRARC